MQNFADYYSNMFARQLLKQQQEKLAADALEQIEPLSNEDIIPETHMQKELSDYPIFFNPGCGHQSAAELNGTDEGFHKRWFSFYRPDGNALPQRKNLKRLELRRNELHQLHARLAAPRMATLMLSVVLATILSVAGDPLLLIIPALLFFSVWYKTQPEVSENTRHLKRNQEWLTQQEDVLNTLDQQLTHEHPKEPVLELQKNYTRTLENFLNDSLREYIPDLTSNHIRDQLHSGAIRLYLLESRGILQLADVGQQNNDNQLKPEQQIAQNGNAFCALQPYEELAGLTRLQYVYVIIRLEEGLVLCNGYYDWVADQLQATRRDFFNWHNITHIKHFEITPDAAGLRNILPEEVYQLHFGDPVQVVSIEIRNGDQHCCVLPLDIPKCHTLLQDFGNTLLVRHLKRQLQPLLADLNRQTRSGKI